MNDKFVLSAELTLIVVIVLFFIGFILAKLLIKNKTDDDSKKHLQLPTSLQLGASLLVGASVILNINSDINHLLNNIEFSEFALFLKTQPFEQKENEIYGEVHLDITITDNLAIGGSLTDGLTNSNLTMDSLTTDYSTMSNSTMCISSVNNSTTSNSMIGNLITDSSIADSITALNDFAALNELPLEEYPIETISSDISSPIVSPMIIYPTPSFFDYGGEIYFDHDVVSGEIIRVDYYDIDDSFRGYSEFYREVNYFNFIRIDYWYEYGELAYYVENILDYNGNVRVADFYYPNGQGFDS